MKWCTFIGHKDCPVEIFDKLYYEIEKLILKENVRIFYVGTNGNFDKMIYQVLEKLESKYNITIYVVLAYLNMKKKNIYFNINKTIFPNTLEKTPLRYAINKRNEYMIKKSDYIICFVKNTFSNSYNYLQVAMKNNLEIINLGSYKSNES
ncbi:MAG: hypothetical protein IJD45_06320 [Clostridia bacterium]|nr:hypothetical protein [Clostridia bacterium]